MSILITDHQRGNQAGEGAGMRWASTKMELLPLDEEQGELLCGPTHERGLSHRLGWSWGAGWLGVTWAEPRRPPSRSLGWTLHPGHVLKAWPATWAQQPSQRPPRCWAAWAGVQGLGALRLVESPVRAGETAAFCPGQAQFAARWQGSLLCSCFRSRAAAQGHCIKLRPRGERAGSTCGRPRPSPPHDVSQLWFVGPDCSSLPCRRQPGREGTRPCLLPQ